MPSKRVVFGFLGTSLDAGIGEKRWERWRPTVSLAAHESFGVDAIELFITKPEQDELAQSVIADMRSQRESLRAKVHLLPIQDPWNLQEVYSALHAFAKGYDFQDDVEYFVHLTTGTHIAQICLFLLLEARYIPGRILESYSHGVPEQDRWKGTLEIVDLDLQVYDQIAQRMTQERADSQSFLKNGIPTLNPAFNQLIERIEKVALSSRAPMLLTGPTGAGKSKLASRIYDLKKRRHLVEGAFVEINCATLRGDNAMSALFGHKKGAFTGAVADRAGVLLEANRGLLFLDEIAELGMDEQAMLLRALEDKKFRPLGADKEVSSNFELLAGTNQDLSQLVAKGKFRADLLARINLWTFKLPGLAERREDISPNLDFETERVSKELNQQVTWSKEARQAFLDYALTAPWPGNFRDLSAAVTRLATLAAGGRITLEDVRGEINAQPSTASPSEKFALARSVLSADAILRVDLFDMAQLEEVLAAVKRSDTMAQAGRILFAATRAQKTSANDSDRLRKYLDRWDLTYVKVKGVLNSH